MRSRRLQGCRGYGSTIWYMDMTLNPDCMSAVPKGPFEGGAGETPRNAGT